MADHRSQKALAAAERLYKRKPDASTEEFRKVCERADKATISKLTNREFNASYVLPFRRSAALRGKSTKKKRRKKTTKRRTTRARRNGRRAASTEQKVVRLIRQRDAELLEAAGDSSKVYDIASRVEEFAAEVVKLSGA